MKKSAKLVFAAACPGLVRRWSRDLLHRPERSGAPRPQPRGSVGELSRASLDDKRRAPAERRQQGASGRELDEARRTRGRRIDAARVARSGRVDAEGDSQVRERGAPRRPQDGPGGARHHGAGRRQVRRRAARQGEPRRDQSGQREQRLADGAVERHDEINVSAAALCGRPSGRRRRDRRHRLADRGGVARPNQPRGFLSIVEKDQGRPELDAERAAERQAAAVFDLDVPDAGMRGESRGDQRLGRAAMAAPRAAELEQRRAGQGSRRLRASARSRGEKRVGSWHRRAAINAPGATVVNEDRRAPARPGADRLVRCGGMPARPGVYERRGGRPDRYACWDGSLWRRDAGSAAAAARQRVGERRSSEPRGAASSKPRRRLARPAAAAPSSIAASTPRPAPT